MNDAKEKMHMKPNRDRMEKLLMVERTEKFENKPKEEK